MSQHKPRSVFMCHSWLTSFLTKRGLKFPDKRPLYAYHATHDEYLKLKSLLVEVGCAEGVYRDVSTAACFTLFCSEWYRRDYEKECGWSWDPIFSVLCFSFSAPILSQVIPKGLESFWDRPLRYYESERRNFLGSLFSEGGLPFRVLKEPDSKFQSVFAKILKQYDQAQLLGHTTTQLVELLIEKSNLPKVFSEDTSIELIGSMTDELVSLVQLYSLNEKSEPVTDLDTLHPKWRDRFPIPLDDVTGSDLLNGLLRTASVETRIRRSKTKESNCLHFWSENDPEVLQVEVSLPLDILFTLDLEPSTTRFELAIYEDGRELASLGAGYAVLEKRQARVKLRKRAVRFNRYRPTAALILVAMVGGLVIGSYPLENSVIDLGEVPVGFAYENDIWQFCGQASFSTKCNKALILLPDGCVITSDHHDVFIETVLLGYKALSINGQTNIVIQADETYKIRIGVSTTTNTNIAFKGKQLTWPCYPALTFIGIPEPELIETDSHKQNVSIFIGGKSVELCQRSETHGIQYVSIKNQDNETLLRRKVGILPVDFNIELKSGQQANQGSIRIYTTHSCFYQLKEKIIQYSRTRNENYIELHLKTAEIPPASIHLIVTPNLEGSPIEIELPFPSSGCLAFDRMNKPLARQLTVESLLGSRVYLFGKDGNPTKFSLELRLRSDKRSHQAHYSWVYKTGERPLELSLFNLREQIENLLSLDTGIDQIVEMQIYGGGHHSTYQIRRHTINMQLDSSRGVLFVTDAKSANGIYPDPVLMLLNEPERKPITLNKRMSEGVPTGEYELPSLIERGGPWLVLPKKNSATSFRPRFISGIRSESTEIGAINTLQKATVIFDPRASVSVFKTVLDAMAIDPAHSGWQFLRSLYDQYGYLPLATFEIWRSLIKHPKALSMSLFKFEMLPDFLSRIESEFPIFWEFSSLYELDKASGIFKEFLIKKGAPAEYLPNLLKKMYGRLGEVFPAYADNLNIWLNDKTVPSLIQMPPQIMKNIVYGWYQELIREHSNASWPEFGRESLQRWLAAQNNCVVDFELGADFRCAVVYLPAFAAAVAAGQVSFSEFFSDGNEAIFFLRQVRDFDSQWFNAVFQYCLLCTITE